MKNYRWGFLTIFLVLLLVLCGWWIVAKGHDAARDYVRIQYVATMIVLLGFCVGAGLMVKDRVDGVLIDDLNRVSLSRAQWLMWFILIVGGYFVEALWNVANNLGMPTIQNQLLVLLGISSGSAVTSTLINENKKTVQTAAPPPAAPGKTAVGLMSANVNAALANWSELYLGDQTGNDDVVDISRLQQIVITLLLGIAFVTLQWAALAAPGASGLTMPSFDDNSSFLWLLGISHAAYIANKATNKT